MMIEYVGGKEAFDDVKKLQDLKCLIILEGLDEVSAKWQQSDELFNQLVIRRTFLVSATVLITSRPHACIELYETVKQAARRVEIIGFNKEQIKDYVNHQLENTQEATKFMRELESFPHIKSLCYVPLSLKMIIEIYQYTNHCFFNTLTEMHESFLALKIKEHLKCKRRLSLGIVTDKAERKLVEKLFVLLKLNDIPQEMVEAIFLLSKLAYCSFFINNHRDTMNPKIVYTTKELIQCNINLNLETDGLGLLKATHIKLLSENASYSFNHLSVQEYFCAVFVALLPEEDQLCLLSQNINKYPHVWPFFAGLTKLKSLDMEKYFQNIISQPMRGQIFITTITCIYEAQLSEPFKESQKQLPIHCYGARLLPYHLMALSFYMSVASVTCLNIPHCSIGDHGVKILAKNDNSLASLEVINLLGCGLTIEGLRVLFKKVNNGLTHLLLAGNAISNDGISALISSHVQLQHLIELDVTQIKMSATGAVALSNFLRLKKNSLESLNISTNDIGDDGALAIAESLQFNNSLLQLIISRCKITCDGAVGISNMLKKNKTLKYLSIYNNPIGDNGITVIAEALFTNSNLKKLNLQLCGFGNEGAKSLIKLLQINKCLNKLNIANNKLDLVDDLLQATTDNCVLDELQIDNIKSGFYEHMLLKKCMDQKYQKVIISTTCVMCASYASTHIHL